jgi:formate dehydrogenase maturation protein FdhE
VLCKLDEFELKRFHACRRAACAACASLPMASFLEVAWPQKTSVLLSCRCATMGQ